MIDLTSVTPLKADPYPFNEDQENWLRELETTDRKQGFGLLKKSGDRYCCLGVACEVLGVQATPVGNDAFEFIVEGQSHSAHLPFSLTKRLRLNHSFGMSTGSNAPLKQPVSVGVVGEEMKSVIQSLTSMNDTPGTDGVSESRFSFKDIAAYIRHDPWNVFLAPDEAA